PLGGIEDDRRPPLPVWTVRPIGQQVKRPLLAKLVQGRIGVVLKEVVGAFLALLEMTRTVLPLSQVGLPTSEGLMERGRHGAMVFLNSGDVLLAGLQYGQVGGLVGGLDF